MTNKKVLDQIREKYSGLQGNTPPFGDLLTLLHILDEQIAKNQELTKALISIALMNGRSIQKSIIATKALKWSVVAEE